MLMKIQKDASHVISHVSTIIFCVNHNVVDFKVLRTRSPSRFNKILDANQEMSSA